jgi:DNA-binding PadR family transcriptional regulator
MTSAHALHAGPFPAHHSKRWAREMAMRAMTGRGHGRHGGPPFGRGFGEFGPGAFGPGFGGPGGPFGRRRRMRRGDVRAALLVLLAEQARNGYGLMQEIEQRSNGAWRPSPGAVYPALSQLEDEGLVEATESDGRKVFQITDAGRSYVEENREELGEPWAKFAEDAESPRQDMRALLMQLGAAAIQVAGAGTDEQVDRARSILVEARRALYRLLAEDDDATGGEPTEQA